MEHGDNTGCPCTICTTGGRSKLSSDGRAKPAQPKATKVHVPKALPLPVTVPEESTFLDEEATPDTIRLLLSRLKKVGELDCEIQEKFSMDWRAEKDIITDSLKTILKQPSWMPRIGELVLFVRNIDDDLEICLENETGEFKLYSMHNKTWSGHPRWEAGVVGQVPSMPLVEGDLVSNVQYESVVYSGFRVEPLPNPDSKDKSLSKQYKYLPLRQLRPFAFHEDYLRGVERWHATVINARTVMSTISLVSRHHFRGTWPTAKISARGVFLGPELLCCGDVIRLLPPASASASDHVGLVDSVLLIEAIKLELTNLDADGDDDEKYNSNAFVYGKAFTTDAAKAHHHDSVQLPPLLRPYDVHWYPLHDQTRSYKVPFNRIASRLYEANAMLLWFPVAASEECVTGPQHLSSGVSSIRSGRLFSSANNKRVPTGKNWYWGDSRAEVLDIETLNSFQVSYHDDLRNDEQIEEWEGAIKVLEHKATAAEKAGFRLQARAKAAGDGMSMPTISAQDVANAEMEEGLRPGALLADSDGQQSGRDSDAPEAPSTFNQGDHLTIEGSQDELDMDNEAGKRDVMSAFGLGKTSPGSEMSKRWPSPSMSIAPPMATPPAQRHRSRPAKDLSNGGSSLKRQIDLSESPSTDDAQGVLDSFKRSKTSASSPVLEKRIRKQKQYDDEDEEEEEDEQNGMVNDALAAFEARAGPRKQFSGVVIDMT